MLDTILQIITNDICFACKMSQDMVLRFWRPKDFVNNCNWSIEKMSVSYRKFYLH